MSGAPNKNGLPHYTPQWNVTKPGELQFMFFEDQELRDRSSDRATIGETNKRPSNSASGPGCPTKRKKL